MITPKTPNHLNTQIVQPLYTGPVNGSPYNFGWWNCFTDYMKLVTDLYKRKAMLNKVIEAIPE